MRQKLTLLGVLVLASVSWVSAQTERYAAVNVPFEFTIGRTVLPAGAYSVDRDTDNNLISFRATSGKSGSMVMIASRGGQSAKASKLFTLVFDKVDGRHYLSEVRYPGQDGFLVQSTHENVSHDIQQAE